MPSRPKTIPAGPPESGGSSPPVSLIPMSLNTSTISSSMPTGSAGIFDEERSVQTEADLRGRHDVRVIPEQSRVGHDEVVGERPAGLHLGLRVAGYAIHLDRDPQAVPVDGGRLRQMIREPHDQPVPDADTDERPRDPAVVGPGLHRQARRDFHRRHARVEMDFDNPRVGVLIDRFAKTHVGVPAVGLVASRGGRDRSRNRQGAEHGDGRARK